MTTTAPPAAPTPPPPITAPPASSLLEQATGLAPSARPDVVLRHLPKLATLLVIGGVIAVILWQVHLPLLFQNSTVTGGDTASHVAMPKILQGLLDHGHITGWDPSWYDGYPIYTFYFFLPDLMAALLAHVIPYNIAFKLVTILGSLLLPIAAWACARLMRARPPIPAIAAAATLPFLFDVTFTIDGGNLFSTLAGEYAFSLGLALALVFLGLFSRGLRSGKGRGLTAAVLALCVFAHVITALFAFVGAAVLWLFELLPATIALRDEEFGATPRLGFETTPRKQSRVAALWWGASTVAIGVLLSAWWLVPFGLNQAYATSMGYTKVTTYAATLWPVADRAVIVLAVLSAFVAFIRRSKFGMLFATLGVLSVLAVWLDPLTRLYNARFLPLYFLCVYVMAGWGLAITSALVARWWRRERLARWVDVVVHARPHERWRRPRVPRWAPGAIGGPVFAMVVALVAVTTPFIAPTWFLTDIHIHPGSNEVSYWAGWNYAGYQDKNKAWPEYHSLMTTMGSIGATDGCGRAMWEYNSNENRFGSPMALMLLPYWTNGCIDSMEGLLFESSTTTPYHFLNQAELSVGPSEPMSASGLTYGAVDVPLGVQHLQLLGVKYFMAFSPQITEEAMADPELTLIKTLPPFLSPYQSLKVVTTWSIFEVRDSAFVTPLPDEPSVLKGVSATQASWLPPSVRWYLDPPVWNEELVADGPKSWPRVTAAKATSPPVVAEPKTTVSDVRQTNSSISFHVSRLGVPVLVKVSYFPNWQATGAQGPWRSTPNLMVVVPTAHDVTLTYGSTAKNSWGEALSALGVLAVAIPPAVLWVRRRRRLRATPARVSVPALTDA